LEGGEGEADDRPPAVTARFGRELLGPVHLLGNVPGDSLVQERLGIRELVIHGVRAALGEERPAIEADELLFQHAPHHVGHIDLAGALACPAREAVAIEQPHEELEVLFLAAVGRGRHEQQVAGLLPEELAETVARGVLGLVPEVAGAHLVGFVNDDEVPVVGSANAVHVLVLLQQVDAADGKTLFRKRVVRNRRFDLRPADEFELEPEFLA